MTVRQNWRASSKLDAAKIHKISKSQEFFQKIFIFIKSISFKIARSSILEDE